MTTWESSAAVGSVTLVVVLVVVGALVIRFARRAAREARLEVGAQRLRLDALDEDNARLRSANEALESFTFLVSHDLKEPVRTTEMLLAILVEDHSAELPPDARDLIERSRRANQQLSRLVASLLDLSRASRIGPRDLAPVEVTSVLAGEECRVRFEEILHERRGVLELDVDVNTLILATPGAVAQIFGNLIANAVQHNDKPAPRVVVRTDLPTRDGFVAFRVEDDGPGFPAALVEGFDAGDFVAPGRHMNGFGLLIARRAVARLGGQLRLASSTQLGGGAVEFELPSPRVAALRREPRASARSLVVLGGSRPRS